MPFVNVELLTTASLPQAYTHQILQPCFFVQAFLLNGMKGNYNTELLSKKKLPLQMPVLPAMCTKYVKLIFA
jgi:hypothetical protein